MKSLIISPQHTFRIEQKRERLRSRSRSRSLYRSPRACAEEINPDFLAMATTYLCTKPETCLLNNISIPPMDQQLQVVFYMRAIQDQMDTSEFNSILFKTLLINDPEILKSLLEAIHNHQLAHETAQHIATLMGFFTP